ncbi:MAG: CAP domain-containing protein [Candidatus Limnocylindrales bacterium]
MSRPERTLLVHRTAWLVALIFGLSSVVSLADPAKAAAWAGDSFSPASASSLIALVNRSRAAAGRPALRVDPTLDSIARWRSNDMLARDDFSHDIPGYGSAFKKLDAVGYCYRIAGENIGWNTDPDGAAAGAIHGRFMKSPGHRANILGAAWDVIGVGAYKSASGRKMWTVLFADSCQVTATPTR